MLRRYAVKNQNMSSGLYFSAWYEIEGVRPNKLRFLHSMLRFLLRPLNLRFLLRGFCSNGWLRFFSLRCPFLNRSALNSNTMVVISKAL
jgi:hypothetical protein